MKQRIAEFVASITPLPFSVFVDVVHGVNHYVVEFATDPKDVAEKIHAEFPHLTIFILP